MQLLKSRHRRPRGDTYPPLDLKIGVFFRKYSDIKAVFGAFLPLLNITLKFPPLEKVLRTPMGDVHVLPIFSNLD